MYKAYCQAYICFETTSKLSNRIYPFDIPIYFPVINLYQMRINFHARFTKKRLPNKAFGESFMELKKAHTLI
jgi:adenine-specific DNA methylase